MSTVTRPRIRPRSHASPGVSDDAESEFKRKQAAALRGASLAFRHHREIPSTAFENAYGNSATSGKKAALAAAARVGTGSNRGRQRLKSSPRSRSTQNGSTSQERTRREGLTHRARASAHTRHRSNAAVSTKQDHTVSKQLIEEAHGLPNMPSRELSTRVDYTDSGESEGRGHAVHDADVVALEQKKSTLREKPSSTHVQPNSYSGIAANLAVARAIPKLSSSLLSSAAAPYMKERNIQTSTTSTDDTSNSLKDLGQRTWTNSIKSYSPPLSNWPFPMELKHLSPPESPGSTSQRRASSRAQSDSSNSAAPTLDFSNIISPSPTRSRASSRASILAAVLAASRSSSQSGFYENRLSSRDAKSPSLEGYSGIFINSSQSPYRSSPSPRTRSVDTKFLATTVKNGSNHSLSNAGRTIEFPAYNENIRLKETFSIVQTRGRPSTNWEAFDGSDESTRSYFDERQYQIDGHETSAFLKNENVQESLSDDSTGDESVEWHDAQSYPSPQIMTNQSSASKSATDVSSLFKDDASSLRQSRRLSQPAIYRRRSCASRPPSQASIVTQVDSLANAIVASSIASSRALSGAQTQSRRFPNRRRHSISSTRLFFSTPSKQPSSSQAASRNSSPQKIILKTTLRSDDRSLSHSHSPEGPKRRGRKHLVRRHHKKHHEGARRRWRDEITESERKRYEGVWAANRGLHTTPPSFAAPSLIASGLSATATTATNIPSLPTQTRNDPSTLVLDLVTKDIWQRSRLPLDLLAEIWQLVNNEETGYLTKEEFVVGMWLVDQCLRGRKLPIRVGDSIWGSVKRVDGTRVKERIDVSKGSWGKFAS